MHSKSLGPVRDNSKSLSVRMTEEQYQRLQRYMGLTHLPVTTYFRKLICGDSMRENASHLQHLLHTEINMLHSNAQQIAYCQRAKKMDAEAVARLLFLINKLCEEVYLLTAQK